MRSLLLMKENLHCIKPCKSSDKLPINFLPSTVSYSPPSGRQWPTLISQPGNWGDNIQRLSSVRAKNPATLGWKRSEKKSYRVQISGFNFLPMAGKMRFSLRSDLGFGPRKCPQNSFFNVFHVTLSGWLKSSKAWQEALEKLMEARPKTEAHWRWNIYYIYIPYISTCKPFMWVHIPYMESLSSRLWFFSGAKDKKQ